MDVVTSMSYNLGVRAEIFGRIYAQTFAIENPAVRHCISEPEADRLTQNRTL